MRKQDLTVALLALQRKNKFPFPQARTPHKRQCLLAQFNQSQLIPFLYPRNSCKIWYHQKPLACPECSAKHLECIAWHGLITAYWYREIATRLQKGTWLLVGALFFVGTTLLLLLHIKFQWSRRLSACWRSHRTDRSHASLVESNRRSSNRRR